MDLMFNFYRDEPRHPGERIFSTYRVFFFSNVEKTRTQWWYCANTIYYALFTNELLVALIRLGRNDVTVKSIR